MRAPARRRSVVLPPPATAVCRGRGRAPRSPKQRWRYCTRLALTAAGEVIPDEAIATLAADQFDDGSWGSAGRANSNLGDTFATALVIQALVAIGHGDAPTVADAVAYLRTAPAA